MFSVVTYRSCKFHPPAYSPRCKNASTEKEIFDAKNMNHRVFQLAHNIEKMLEYLEENIDEVKCNGHNLFFEVKLIKLVKRVRKFIVEKVRRHPKTDISFPAWEERKPLLYDSTDAECRKVMRDWCTELDYDRMINERIRTKLASFRGLIRLLRLKLLPRFLCEHHLQITYAKGVAVQNYIQVKMFSNIDAHLKLYEVGNEIKVEVTAQERAQYNEWMFETRRFDAEFHEFQSFLAKRDADKRGMVAKSLKG